MTTNVLVAFYSTYGHIHRMALAVAEGAEGVPDTAVRLRRIAELEEARKALAAQDAYVRAQQEQAAIPVVTHEKPLPTAPLGVWLPIHHEKHDSRKARDAEKDTGLSPFHLPTLRD